MVRFGFEYSKIQDSAFFELTNGFALFLATLFLHALIASCFDRRQKYKLIFAEIRFNKLLLNKNNINNVSTYNIMKTSMQSISLMEIINNDSNIILALKIMQICLQKYNYFLTS